MTTTLSYDYNAANRLSTFTDATGARNLTWDADGNRLSFGTQQFTYNADDSLKTATDSTGGNAKAPTYHPWGGLADDGCATYAYDGFDRTASVTSKTGPGCGNTVTTTTYSYDGLDRQRSRTENGTRTDFAYDGRSDEVVVETAGANRLEFALGPMGNRKAYSKNGNGSAAWYLAEDGTGNVSTVTAGGSAAAAAVACTVRYDPYGTPLSPVGADNPCNTGSTEGSAFYRAARRDKATGAYQFGSRTYDPSKAAFLTPDGYRADDSAKDLSIGVDPLTNNRYSYVNGDPVNLVDPDGHWSAANCAANDIPPEQCAAMRARGKQRAEEAERERKRIGEVLGRRPTAARPLSSWTESAWTVLGLEEDIQKAAAEFDIDPKTLRRLLAQEGGWAAVDGLAGMVIDRKRQSLGVASIRPNAGNLKVARQVFGDANMTRDELAARLLDNAFSVRLSAAILRNNITTHKLDSTGIKEETEYRAFMSYAMSPNTIASMNQNDWDFAAIKARDFPMSTTTTRTTTTTTPTKAIKPEIDRGAFDRAYERGRYYAWWDQQFSNTGR